MPPITWGKYYFQGLLTSGQVNLAMQNLIYVTIFLPIVCINKCCHIMSIHVLLDILHKLVDQFHCRLSNVLQTTHQLHIKTLKQHTDSCQFYQKLSLLLYITLKKRGVYTLTNHKSVRNVSGILKQLVLYLPSQNDAT